VLRQLELRGAAGLRAHRAAPFRIAAAA
jgi:hypothetical protein